MKHRKASPKKSTNEEKTKPTDKKAIIDDDEELNSGFSEWLRTGEGVAYMRWFVVFNSLIVFLSMSWPQMTTTVKALISYFTEEEDF